MSLLSNTHLGIILALIILSSGQLANAIPAFPEPIRIEQPDGSVITLRMYGDESGFKVVTTDNLPVMKNHEGIYEYVNPWNTSSCSGMKVSEISERTASEKAWIATSGITSATAHILRNKGAIVHKEPWNPRRIKISNYPTIGKQKALVVLVEFADKKFSTVENAYTYYNDMLNKEGFFYSNGANGSARDYYIDSSLGLFEPEFVVVGPITLPETVAYYGANTDNTLDPNAWEMVLEACTAIDKEIDFSQFDSDHDGYVDSVYFFYAGFGEADSIIGDTIWPHNGLLKDNWGVNLNLDGVTINNYACSNEIRFNSAPIWQPVGIGTFVHEFGHVLGLADHYDTLYTSGRSGVEEWDTMASASYHNNQNTPPSFSAYERAELGWLELTEINPLQEGLLNVYALGNKNSNALVIRVPGYDADEFFVIERRNKTGWDSYLPSEGLLVWHIDMVEELWSTNRINIDPIHQHIDIVEADGTENATSFHGDVFPGSKKVTKFDFIDWSGAVLFSFDHIVQLSDASQIILGNTKFRPATPEITISNVHGTSFNVSWYAGTDVLGYTLTVYGSDGEIVDGFGNLSFNEAGSIKVYGLEPETNYKVEVCANVGSYVSELTSQSVSTGPLEFFESAPQNLAVKHIGNNRFYASWDSLFEANDYEVTLYRMEYGESYEFSYGFEDGLEGMPEDWFTNSNKISKPVFGEKSPALKFEDNGDFLEIRFPECEITSLSFYHSSQVDSNILMVMAFNSAGEVVSEQPIHVSSNGKAETLNLPATCERITISFKRSSGYAILDDIVATVKKLERVPCNPYIAFSTSGQTSVTIDGLEEEIEYGLIVEGLNDTEKSRPSEMLSFVPSSVSAEVTITETAHDTYEEWFDTYGNKVPASQATRGIYIIRKGNVARKVAIR